MSVAITVLGFITDHWILFRDLIIATFAAKTLLGIVTFFKAVSAAGVGAAIKTGGAWVLAKLNMLPDAIITAAAWAASVTETVAINVAGAVAVAAAWLAANPFVLIAAAIIALGVLIYKYRREIWAAAQAIGSWFAGIGRRIANAFSGAIDSIRGFFGSMFDWVSAKVAALWQDIKDVGNWLADHSYRAVGKALGAVSDFVTGADGDKSKSTTRALLQTPPALASASYTKPVSANGDMGNVAVTNNVTLTSTNADPKAVMQLAQGAIQTVLDQTKAAVGANGAAIR